MINPLCFCTDPSQFALNSEASTTVRYTYPPVQTGHWIRGIVEIALAFANWHELVGIHTEFTDQVVVDRPCPSLREFLVISGTPGSVRVAFDRPKSIFELTCSQ